MNPQSPKMTYIAGYGLLKSRGFVETLLGRSLKSTESVMTLHGYELRVVDRENLPLSVQRETPPGFRIYGLAKGTLNNKVGIRLLQLTEEEYELVRMVDFGNAVFKAEETTTLMVDRNYYSVHVLQDQSLGKPAEVSEEGEYELYLNGNEEDAITIAQEIRKNWLASRSPEGKPSRVERE